MLILLCGSFCTWIKWSMFKINLDKTRLDWNRHWEGERDVSHWDHAICRHEKFRTAYLELGLPSHDFSSGSAIVILYATPHASNMLSPSHPPCCFNKSRWKYKLYTDEKCLIMSGVLTPSHLDAFLATIPTHSSTTTNLSPSEAMHRPLVLRRLYSITIDCRTPDWNQLPSHLLGKRHASVERINHIWGYKFWHHIRIKTKVHVQVNLSLCLWRHVGDMEVNTSAPGGNEKASWSQ